MNAIAQEELGYLDAPFIDSEEPEVGSVPDGTYHARIDSMELRNAQTSGRPMLNYDFVIIDGEYEGRHLFRNNMIPQKGDSKDDAMRSLGFLKRDLRACGINPDAPNFSLSSFLTGGLDVLLDRVVELSCKTKKDSNGQDRQNVYIQKCLSGEQAEPAKGKQDDNSPFADE